MQQELIPAPEPMVMPEEETVQDQEIQSEDASIRAQQLLLMQSANSLKLTRRQSLPASDPFHRIFDQMIQPDVEQPRAVATNQQSKYLL